MMLKTLKKFAGIASKTSLVAAGLLCCASAYALDADAEGLLINGDHIYLNDSTVFTEDLVGKHDTITYSRDLTSEYGTLCLPFAYNESQIENEIMLYRINYFRDTVVILKQIDRLESIKAGEPIIFFVKDITKKLSVEVKGLTMVSTPVASTNMTGTFVRDTVRTDADQKFFIKDNKFMRGNGNFIVPPFHAMLHVAGQANALKSLSIYAEDEIEGDFEGASQIDPAAKMQGIYNIKGQPVKEMLKNEVYIIKMSDGTSKKVFVE